jgi:D-inositol-3-phosphate glycosyltransferase
MKVAFVSEHANPLDSIGGVDAGGQNIYVEALARRLAHNGASVTVYTRRSDPSAPVRVAMAPGVVVEHVDAGPATALSKDDMWPHMDEFAHSLQAAWTLDRPDAVHSHFWMSGYAAIQAAHPLDLPIAHTFHALGSVKKRHQGNADTSPRERIDIERMIVREADCVIATCTDEVRELDRLGHIHADLRVIPCGVDVTHFSPAGQSERPMKPRILAVSRLVPRKGIEDVVRALALVPDAELVIAGGSGDGDAYANHLRKVAQECGVADRVDMRGPVNRNYMPVLMRSASIGVCTPWYEPFGIAPLEFMACGVPVLASAVGGMLDTVADGQTGRLVEPRNVPAIASTLRSMLGDRKELQRMSRASVIRSASYGWNHIAWRMRAVYGDMISGSAFQHEEVMEGAL